MGLCRVASARRRWRVDDVAFTLTLFFNVLGVLHVVHALGVRQAGVRLMLFRTGRCELLTVGTNEKFMVSIIESHHRAILEICSLPEVNFVNHVEIYERLSALAWLLRRGLQQIIQKNLLSRKQCIDEWVMRILGMSILASLITEQPMLHFLPCAS